MADWSESETYVYILRMSIFGIVLGCLLGICVAALYIIVSFMVTGPLDGSVTLGELYDASMNRYPQLILAIGLAAVLAAFTATLPALIHPSIPPFCPPRSYITWMFAVDCIAGSVPTIGYCAFGWVGFGVGCLVPFLVFPWHVRKL